MRTALPTSPAMRDLILAVMQMSSTLAKYTGGGRGIRRIAVSPQAGAEIGVMPGESIWIAASGGRVEVFCEVGDV